MRMKIFTTALAYLLHLSLGHDKIPDRHITHCLCRFGSEKLEEDCEGLFWTK